METTSLNELRAHLHALGLRDGIKSLIVHSSLISFGRLECRPSEIFEAIRSQLAEDCTIFAPTFTTNLQETEVFNPLTTRSQGMGVFSEHIRTRQGAIRSTCPMHSYAGCGPDAEVLLDADPTLSFGPGSCFEKLRNMNPHLLLLGCPFYYGATHIHQVEAEVGVPFRTWLDLTRTVATDDGTQESMALRYYGIRDRQTTKWSPIRVLEHLQQNNQIAEQSAVRGRSYMLTIADLDFAARTVLYKDNNALNVAKQEIAA